MAPSKKQLSIAKRKETIAINTEQKRLAEALAAATEAARVAKQLWDEKAARVMAGDKTAKELAAVNAVKIANALSIAIQQQEEEAIAAAFIETDRIDLEKNRAVEEAIEMAEAAAREEDKDRPWTLALQRVAEDRYLTNTERACASDNIILAQARAHVAAQSGNSINYSAIRPVPGIVTRPVLPAAAAATPKLLHPEKEKQTYQLDRVIWEDTMTRSLLDFLVSVTEGGGGGNTASFNDAQYTQAAKYVRMKTSCRIPSSFCGKTCRNKLKAIKKTWREWLMHSSINGKSGWAEDPLTGALTADETVMDIYFASYPQYNRWRGGFPRWREQQEKIFAGQLASGDFAGFADTIDTSMAWMEREHGDAIEEEEESAEEIISDSTMEVRPSSIFSAVEGMATPVSSSSLATSQAPPAKKLKMAVRGSNDAKVIRSAIQDSSGVMADAMKEVAAAFQSQGSTIADAMAAENKHVENAIKRVESLTAWTQAERLAGVEYAMTFPRKAPFMLLRSESMLLAIVSK